MRCSGVKRLLARHLQRVYKRNYDGKGAMESFVVYLLFVFLLLARLAGYVISFILAFKEQL
ncbi:hypothetical protein BDQ12DRAFT_63342 [Crucibulum laeve]|uniref:Uncharacterized protein n=1 Tax=Crucibulum laeve TaxID=68775 RepID=A0A5C3M489_9AGAR|nr:hypothetical protein BDQ12DRAFT_63342 [Crucibulum laeve]